MSMSSSTCYSKFVVEVTGSYFRLGSAVQNHEMPQHLRIQAVFTPGFSQGRQFSVWRLWRFEKPLAMFLPASIGLSRNCVFLKDRSQFLPHVFVFYFFFGCWLWCRGPIRFGDLKYDNIPFILHCCRTMCALDKNFRMTVLSPFEELKRKMLFGGHLVNKQASSLLLTCIILLAASEMSSGPTETKRTFCSLACGLGVLVSFLGFRISNCVLICPHFCHSLSGSLSEKLHWFLWSWLFISSATVTQNKTQETRWA